MNERKHGEATSFSIRSFIERLRVCFLCLNKIASYPSLAVPAPRARNDQYLTCYYSNRAEYRRDGYCFGLLVIDLQRPDVYVFFLMGEADSTDSKANNPKNYQNNPHHSSSFQCRHPPYRIQPNLEWDALGFLAGCTSNYRLSTQTSTPQSPREHRQKDAHLIQRGASMNIS